MFLKKLCVFLLLSASTFRSGAAFAQEHAGSVTRDGLYVFIHGPIKSGVTVREFLRAVGDDRDLIVELDSPGGSLIEGLNLAAIVDNFGLSTWIPHDALCASSCSIVFLAGSPRTIDGRLGVHQFSSRHPTFELSPAETQSLLAVILQDVSSYQSPQVFFDRMLATPSDQMFWFDAQDQSLFERQKPDGINGFSLGGASNIDFLFSRPFTTE